jgi:hemerythrin-like domain-containing protein
MNASPNSRTARPPRPARATAPPVSGAELLDLTHRQMQQVLAQMVALADLLGRPARDPDSATLAAQVCSFFNGTARGHHEAEETTVFPALLAAGAAEVRDHVRRLQQDHMWLEEDWLELEPHLQAVASGYCDAHRDFLRPALREYAGLCHEHMELEEALLHPRAGHATPVPRPVT